MGMEYKATTQIKAADINEDLGQISGYVSTYGGPPDAYGDIIEEGAFDESLSKGGRNGTGIPLLWQHLPEEPLGWHKLSSNKTGLKTNAQLIMELGRAPEILTMAKSGLLGFSIGFDVNPDKDSYEIVKRGGKTIRYLKKIDLWEASLVTFPANIRARITNVKSIQEIEEALKTGDPRELERILREAEFSRQAAKALVSRIQFEQREADEEADEGLERKLNLILSQIQEEKQKLQIKKLFRR